MFFPLALAQPRTFTVPFDLHGGLILLKGELNGKPATFLLDTGSNVSFLDMHVAGLIQFKAEKVRRVGMAGCLLAHAALNLGGQSAPEQKFCVADLSDVSKSVGARVDGFIGADVLSEFRQARINFETRTLELEM